MKLSLNGHLETLSHEAIVTSPYKDSVGVWTIAVGHTAAAGPPDPNDIRGDILSVDECLKIFMKDVALFERQVHKFIKAPMTQTEFDAWFSFLFNTGGKNRKTGKPYTCIPKFNAGQKQAAYRALMSVNNKGLLTERRAKERDLMRDGKYSHDGKVSIYPASFDGKVLWGKGKRIDVSDTLRRLMSPGKTIPIGTPTNIKQPAPTKTAPKGNFLFRIFSAIWSALFKRNQS